MKKVLIPLPLLDFEPSETAVPWKYFSDNGFEITFATPEGKVAQADRVFRAGKGLGIFKWLLSTNKNAIPAYEEMITSKEFKNPISWESINSKDYDAISITGGHGPGMRQLMESTKLHQVLIDFMADNKPIGAVCHGVVLLARAISPTTGKSILHGKKVTCLLPIQENTGWILTIPTIGDHFKTYRGRTVRSEVQAALAKSSDFKCGFLPLVMDSKTSKWNSFTVVDGNLVTARWPGDIHLFAETVSDLIKNS